MNVRSLLGSLQVPVAAVGILLMVTAVLQYLSLETPARPDVPHGFAMFFLYGLVWLGFVLTSLGLTIPPGEGYGISFRRGQRVLFVIAALASVGSAILPFVLFGLFFQQPNLIVYSWLLITGLAVLSFLTGIGWRVVDTVQARLAEK